MQYAAWKVFLDSQSWSKSRWQSLLGAPLLQFCVVWQLCLFLDHEAPCSVIYALVMSHLQHALHGTYPSKVIGSCNWFRMQLHGQFWKHILYNSGTCNTTIVWSTFLPQWDWPAPLILWILLVKEFQLVESRKCKIFWNILPSEVWNTLILLAFRKGLKTWFCWYMFCPDVEAIDYTRWLVQW